MESSLQIIIIHPGYFVIDVGHEFAHCLNLNLCPPFSSGEDVTEQWTREWRYWDIQWATFRGILFKAYRNCLLFLEAMLECGDMRKKLKQNSVTILGTREREHIHSIFLSHWSDIICRGFSGHATLILGLKYLFLKQWNPQKEVMLGHW